AGGLCQVAICPARQLGTAQHRKHDLHAGQCERAVADTVLDASRPRFAGDIDRESWSFEAGVSCRIMIASWNVVCPAITCAVKRTSPPSIAHDYNCSLSQNRSSAPVAQTSFCGNFGTQLN